MSQHLEVEAKFSVSESTTIPDLSEIHGVAGISSSEVHHLSAVYFDTADLRLTRAKITLRRRTGGNDAGWHIKFPGTFGRREVQAGLDDPGADESTPPPALLGQVRALLRGQDLVPIAQVDNERHVSYLCDEAGLIVGEFCDDHVSTISYLPGGSKQQWREWEFELAAALSSPEAGGELLRSASTILTSAGAFVADSPSKLLSALGDSIKHAPTPPGMAKLPKDDPARAVLAAIKTNADKIVDYDPKVRADEWDSVHQMRVATRELRSHMQTFEGILGGEVYQQVEEELKLLATILGRARDAEVIEERLTHLMETETSQVVAEETKEELLTEMGSDYAREHLRVVAALDSQRYAQLLKSLEEILADPPLTTTATTLQAAPDEPPVPTESEEHGDGQPADSQEYEHAENLEEIPATISAEPVPAAEEKVDAVTVLLTHLDKAHTKVVKLHKKALREWSDQEIPVAQREENFHKVRKAVKKLRYSAEAVGNATPVKTRKLYRACSKLQSVLGDFQDAVTSRDELLHRAELAHRKGKDNFAYGVLYQQEQTLSRKYLEDYPDAYQAVVKAYDKLREKTSTASAAKVKKKKK